jgi:transcriptional regulator with XRE-family HTH domain
LLRTAIPTFAFNWADESERFGWNRAGQFEMSERVGIDRSYLAEVETGKIEICLRNLAVIAETFGLKPWQLLTFSNKGQ